MQIICALILLLVCPLVSAHNCFTKIQGRFTNWEVFLSIPGYKAGSKRQYGCKQHQNCFSTPQQFFKYFGIGKQESKCQCEHEQTKICTLKITDGDNKGLRTTYDKNNQFIKNQEYISHQIEFVFKKKMLHVSYGLIPEWHLHAAYPLEYTSQTLL